MAEVQDTCVREELKLLFRGAEPLISRKYLNKKVLGLEERQLRVHRGNNAHTFLKRCQNLFFFDVPTGERTHYKITCRHKSKRNLKNFTWFCKCKICIIKNLPSLKIIFHHHISHVQVSLLFYFFFYLGVGGRE